MKESRLKLKKNPYYRTVNTLFCKLCKTNRGVMSKLMYCRRCLKDIANYRLNRL